MGTKSAIEARVHAMETLAAAALQALPEETRGLVMAEAFVIAMNKDRDGKLLTALCRLSATKQTPAAIDQRRHSEDSCNQQQ